MHATQIEPALSHLTMAEYQMSSDLNNSIENPTHPFFVYHKNLFEESNLQCDSTRQSPLFTPQITPLFTSTYGHTYIS